MNKVEHISEFSIISDEELSKIIEMMYVPIGTVINCSPNFSNDETIRELIK